MEEKEQKFKIVDVSFAASFKFWLAYLVVQIIVFVIVFGITAAIMFWLVQSISSFIPRYPWSPTINIVLNAIMH